jgi:tetratricopeptide (TPR) repeat protein
MWLVSGLLALVVLVAFSPVLRSDFTRFDDPQYVTDNPHVATGLSVGNILWAFRASHASNWHPVTWLSHMLDAELFGLRPSGHHATSLLLHVANTLLLLLFCVRATGDFWRSLIVAALFALHPLHVESVAWVAERKDVLSTFFFLIALLTYSKYLELSREGVSQVPESKVEGPDVIAPSFLGRAGRSARFWYFLTLAGFALGLMSKPMLVTLPFVLLLLDFWPFKRFGTDGPSGRDLWGSGRRLIIEKLPFLCLAAVSCLITFMVQSQAHAVTVVLPLGRRIANAVASYWKYIGKSFWPSDLTIYYPHPDTRFPISEQWPLWVIGLAAVALVGFSLLALFRASRQPWFFTGWFWFLGTLVPVIGIVQVGGQAMADRYTYIPLIGLFLAFTWAGSELLSRWPIPKPFTAGVLAIMLGACAVVSFRQAGTWKDNFTLFSHSLAVTRNNGLANYHVGVYHGESGNYPLALKHFRESIAAAPAAADGYFGLAHTLNLMGKKEEAVEQYRVALRGRPWDEWIHSRLGSTLWSLGRTNEAMKHFQEALKINPDFFEARSALASALMDLGDYPAAADQLRRAFLLKPDSTETLVRWAECLLKTGRPAEAEARFRDLVKLDPRNPENYINLGGMLWMRGQRIEALAAYKQAVQLNPAYAVAQFNLATALYGLNRFAEAEAGFAEAVRLKPDYAQALNGLGKALAAQNKLSQAARRFQEAIQLRPDAASFYNLGLALAGLGRTAEAAREFRQALQLRPDWPPALHELAWLLAVSPDPALRNGSEAVKLAEKASQLTGGSDYRFLCSLDAAYAEAGRFSDAIATAEKVRSLATAAGQKPAVDAADARLKLYRENRPFRTSARSE